MLNIKPIQAQKGFEALAETLKDQILDGTIEEGQMLNERELVDQSGLSRGSVREALRVLETQGLVATKRGRNGGRIAKRLGSDIVKDSLDIFIRGRQVPFSALIETVEVFEPSLAELAARHRTRSDIARLQSEIDQLTVADDPSAFVAANTQWHQAIARASHNPILISIYTALGSELLDPKVSGFVSADIRAAVIKAANQVLDAIIEGDADQARRRMERHVKAYREQLEQHSGAGNRL